MVFYDIFLLFYVLYLCSGFFVLLLLYGLYEMSDISFKTPFSADSVLSLFAFVSSVLSIFPFYVVVVTDYLFFCCEFITKWSVFNVFFFKLYAKL